MKTRSFLCAIISFILVCFLVLSILIQPSKAVNTELSDAPAIGVGDIDLTFCTYYDDDAYDQIRWFVFTPNTSGYYDFDIAHPYYSHAENDTMLCIYDSYADAFDEENYHLADMEQSTSYISTRRYCNKNQHYYINIEICACLGFEKPYTMTLSISPNTTYLSKTTLSSAKNTASKKMTVKWKRNEIGSGYQLQYSTDKKFIWLSLLLS